MTNSLAKVLALAVMPLDVRLPPTLRPLIAAIMQAARDLHGER